MERYRSVGTTTIVALMAIDRIRGRRSAGVARAATLIAIGPPQGDRAPPGATKSHRNPRGGAAAIINPATEMMPAMGLGSSQIGRRCERAVVTAYRNLRADGVEEVPAFRACTTLYRIHHPDASVDEARRLVAEWIDHHLTRRAAGPTPGCDCD